MNTQANLLTALSLLVRIFPHGKNLCQAGSPTYKAKMIQKAWYDSE